MKSSRLVSMYGMRFRFAVNVGEAFGFNTGEHCWTYKVGAREGLAADGGSGGQPGEVGGAAGSPVGLRERAGLRPAEAGLDGEADMHGGPHKVHAGRPAHVLLRIPRESLSWIASLAEEMS
eukprot:scaffold127899_cov17-Prasinocladus_malaysianus.AAC.1